MSSFRMIRVDLIDPSPFAHLSPPDLDNQEAIRLDLEANGGLILNPLHAIQNGERWELLAGHDRLGAAIKHGLTEVPVRNFSAIVTTDDEKVSHLLRDNNARKNADKEIGCRWALLRHTDWSNRKLADFVGASEGTLRNLRSRMEDAEEIQRPAVVESIDGSKRPTKPRTVRTSVPSKRGIPHPTAKVPAYESAADMADALTKRKVGETPGVAAGEPTGNEDITLPPEVGVPAGVDPLVSTGEYVKAPNVCESDAPEVGTVPTEAVISSVPTVVDTAHPGVGPGDVSRSSMVAEFVARLPIPSKATPDEIRTAALCLTAEQLEATRQLHRWLGTFLLQAEIARKESTKQGAAA